MPTSCRQLAAGALRSGRDRPEPGSAAARSPLRAPAVLRRCACGGGCPRCRAKAAAPASSDLRINEPGDAWEREADRIADAVMSGASAPPSDAAGPPSGTLRRCACGGSCPSCRAKKEEEDETNLLQREAAGPSAPAVAPPIVHDVLASPGRPLDAETRAFMEDGFGADFGGVRVHADARAAESAAAVAAHAYTVGSRVVFGAGRYAPGTAAGDRLIAHELAHVLQDAGGAPRRLARKPTRSGVSEGRYTFSTNCGWIDWSHANPAIAAALIQRVLATSEAMRAAGPGVPPEMGDFTSPVMSSNLPITGMVLSSARVGVRLVRALSPAEIRAVALAIYKELSIVFETQQAWTDLLGESSFSQEDLPSNLISFYMAAEGLTRDDVNQVCGSLDVEGSRREFERDDDFERNRGFAPVGATGSWPAELSTIDDSAAAGLFEIRWITARQGTEITRYCPRYRLEGRVGETDLFIIGIGGTVFKASDDVQVIPTYRSHETVSGSYGHVREIEVVPARMSDRLMLRGRQLDWPLWVPEPVLACLSSLGNPI